MDIPPTRYRVVEQGRRLVVIDSRTGGPVHPAAKPPAERPRTMEAPRPQLRPEARQHSTTSGPPEPAGRYAGGEGFSFVTARWYDKEAPRRVRLSQDGQGQLFGALAIAAVVAIFIIVLIGWPIAFVLVFIVFNAKVRDGFRTAATTWLTALDRNEG